MRRILVPLALVGLLALSVRPAAAQTTLFNQLQQFGPATVLYNPFHVAEAGLYTIHTSPSGDNYAVDPYIWLFTNWATNGAGLGGVVAFNDDGNIYEPGYVTCGGAGGTCYSTIFLQALGVGDYTVAASVYDLTEQGARDGIGGVESPGQAGFSICSQGGTDWSTCQYNLSVVEVTPEPASILLLSTGLLGLAGLRRRKTTA